MAVNIYKIKKWINMLSGKSVHHVNQDEGKIYSKTQIKGYYNNLTEKVSRFGLSGNEIPKSFIDTGEEIYFSIEIFQYGLGAYDLYLLNHDKKMFSKTLACADWALEHQKENGGWETFSKETPQHPYSSMAQGEGISLLLRVYEETQEFKYMEATEKAMKFMLKSVEEGGTTRYIGNEIYFMEYTHAPLVLNGWIFSIWGLWDYWKETNDVKSKKILFQTIHTLENELPKFDIGFWSKYEEGKRICSPFYHRLHIAQLRVMYELTEIEAFREYANKWEKYSNSFIKSKCAFIIKSWQKIVER